NHAGGHTAVGWYRGDLDVDGRFEFAVVAEYFELADRAGNCLLDDGRLGRSVMDALLVMRAVRSVGDSGGHGAGSRSRPDSAGRRECCGPWRGCGVVETLAGVDRGNSDRSIRRGGR